MKMGSAKPCELLAAGFLFLALWTDPIEACICKPETALQAYCRSEIAVKLQVLGVTEIGRGIWRSWRYRIKVTKVFKGPKSLRRVRALDISENSNFCYYTYHGPFNKDEYVFTGSRSGKHLTTHLCDFQEKWDSLSDEDKRGFKGDFKGACD